MDFKEKFERMKVRIVDSENEKTIMVFDIEDELYDDIKKMAEGKI